MTIRNFAAKSLGLLGFVLLFAGQTVPASAGSNCYYKNGEQYCMSTSDGSGFRPSSFQVTTLGHGAQGPHTKAEAAVQVAQLRRQRFH